jgi:methyl-accepting chemotaxis protein
MFYYHLKIYKKGVDMKVLNLTLVRKISLIVILGFVLIIIVLQFNQSSAINSLSKKYIDENVKTKLKSILDSELISLNAYYNKMKQDKLSEDKIRTNIIEFVKNSRYGKTGYFWINDFVPKMIMHPMKPQLDGKDLSKSKDPNGVYLFNEMVKVGGRICQLYVAYAGKRQTST